MEINCDVCQTCLVIIKDIKLQIGMKPFVFKLFGIKRSWYKNDIFPFLVALIYIVQYWFRYNNKIAGIWLRIFCHKWFTSHVSKKYNRGYIHCCVEIKVSTKVIYWLSIPTYTSGLQQSLVNFGSPTKVCQDFLRICR